MDALTIRNVNAMPAPTWSWLRMNSTSVRVPADLVPAFGAYDVEAEDSVFGTPGAFELALAALRDELKGAPCGSDAADTPARAALVSARGEVDALDLDYPALSSYQRAAELSRAAADAASDFESGCGSDTTSYLNFLAGERTTLIVKQGEVASAYVRVEAEDGFATAAAIDAVAEADSTLKLAISLVDPAAPAKAARMGGADAAAGQGETAGATDTPTAGDTTASAASIRSLIGSTLRIFAGARSQVELVVYSTVGGDAIAIDDTGITAAEGARVTVRHVVLSGKDTVTGLACDLRGEASRVSIDTRYLAGGSETRDFNYTVRHHGRRTVSTMDANGVLGGHSKKTLRGTIDLIRGAKGAEGTERETVLLASEGVDNKTIPSILCNEDDVAGNHGATIGHVRPDQLFYAACRGLAQRQTEALFGRAKLDDAALGAPNEQMRDDVIALGEAMIPGFADDLFALDDETRKEASSC